MLSAELTNIVTLFSPASKFSFPIISTLASVLLASAVIFKSFTKKFNFKVYECIEGSNPSEKFTPAISNLDSPNTAFVLSVLELSTSLLTGSVVLLVFSLFIVSLFVVWFVAVLLFGSSVFGLSSAGLVLVNSELLM